MGKRSLTGLVMVAMLWCLGAGVCRAASLEIGPTSFCHAYVHPRLSEDGLPGELKGGRLEVVLQNRSDATVPLSRVLLNGRSADDLTAEGQVHWWRAWPEQVPPGGFSALTIQGAAALMKEGAVVALTVNDVTATIPLVTPVLSISSVSISEDLRSAVVHLRNDDPTRGLRLLQVAVLGHQAEVEPLADEIPPLRTTICLLRFDRALRFLEMLALVARAETADGDPVQALGTFRAFRTPFPIGTWVGPQADPEHLKNLAGIGIDGLIDGGGPEAVAAMDGLCKQYGMRLLSHTGWGEANVSEFVTGTTANKPWSLALALMDEPDLHSGKDAGGLSVARFTERGNRKVWQLTDARPTFVNLCRPGTFPEFARIADIVGYDAYQVGAPGDEASHWGYARDLEAAAWYMWALHRNAEPSPTWAWSQGYHGWTHRLIFGLLTTGKPGRALVTPSECRVQLVQELGRGIKGLWWFLCLSKAGTEKQFWTDLEEGGAPEWERLKSMAAPGVDLSAYPQLTKETLAPIIAEAMKPWDELWNEIRNLNSVVRQIRDLLQEGDTYEQRQFDIGWGASPRDLATVASPDALVVFLTNLGYYQTCTGAVFRPVAHWSVTAELPPWLTPADVFEVTAAGPRDAAWKANDASVEITVDGLEDVRFYVVAADRSLRQACAEKALAQR